MTKQETRVSLFNARRLVRKEWRLLVVLALVNFDADADSLGPIILIITIIIYF